MNYSEFKSDVIRRAKEHSACREEFEKAINAKTFEELFEVVKSNFFWCCRNEIITPETLTQVLKEANKCGVWVNQNCESGYLLASGNATVEASGNATVEALGNATVEASGNATVEALDNATVEASGNATVEASGNATVRASGNATVEALDNATVEASGNSFIRNYSTISVKQSENSIVVYPDRVVLGKHRKVETF